MYSFLKKALLNLQISSTNIDPESAIVAVDLHEYTMCSTTNDCKHSMFVRACVFSINTLFIFRNSLKRIQFPKCTHWSKLYSVLCVFYSMYSFLSISCLSLHVSSDLLLLFPTESGQWELRARSQEPKFFSCLQESKCLFFNIVYFVSLSHNDNITITQF